MWHSFVLTSFLQCFQLVCNVLQSVIKCEWPSSHFVKFDFLFREIVEMYWISAPVGSASGHLWYSCSAELKVTKLVI